MGAALRPGVPTRPAAALAIAGSLLLAALSAGSALAAGAVAKYTFSPSPIAATASLAANATVSVTVTARDATNTAVPGAIIFVSLSQTTGGGSAAVGATPISATPQSFVATASGTVTITYKTPAVLPTGGKDILKAANAKSAATITASDVYSFARAAKYVAAPTPIAPPGTIAANGSVTVTVTAETSLGVAVPNVAIYLSFTAATGGGHAAVGLTALSTTPTKFTANASGQVAVTYTAPATLPASGTDSLVAADAAKNPTISKTDSYSFAGPTSYLASPSPIAATGTLTAGATRTVTFTAKDLSGNPVSGARVYLSFVAAASGGTAFVGSKALSTSASPFLTNSSGQIIVTYHASATPPASGTDTIVAQNLRTAPTLTASDGYTY